MSSIARQVLDLMPLYHRVFSTRLYHKEEGDPAALTRSQEKALMVIAKQGRTQPRDLGHCLDLRPGSLTPLLDDLETRGLLHRQTAPEDRRCHLLELTEAGRTWVDQRENRLLAEVEAILAPLAPADRQSLETQLAGLNALLRRL